LFPLNFSATRTVQPPETHAAAAASLPSRTIVELNHSAEVWCVAFSPDGCMLATASADGAVKLWLVGENASFSTTVDCRGADKSPLLLRWNGRSSSVLCCSANQQSFHRWDISSVALAEGKYVDGLDCCFCFDQSFDVVFADFLTSGSSGPDMLISCTVENHIFICDSANKLISTFVGGGCVVTGAALITTRELTRGASCPLSSSTPASHDLNQSAAQQGLLVSSSKNDTITLFLIASSSGCDNLQMHHQAYEIIPSASFSVGLPVLSLTSYSAHCSSAANNRLIDCSDDACAAPIALAVTRGGTLITISHKVFKN
jgi:WD40 repeat protein